MSDTVLISSLRAEARDAPESGIVEVFNYGRNRPGLIPLWVGEGDLPTPDFIIAAANQSHECAVLLRRHIQEREDELDEAEDEGS